LLVDERAAPFDQQTIRRHYQEFTAKLTECAVVDKSRAQDALKRLYAKAGSDEPAILWCQSPYQLLTMPSLLIGLTHSDFWDLIAGDLTARASVDSWNEYWDSIWPDVWSNGGLPLLKGMTSTTRLGEVYRELEGALIAQVKQEFGKALHSRRLDSMQQKLKREIYRRFWAPHVRDVAKPVWVRLKNDVFSQMSYLRSQNSDWPFWNLIVTMDRNSVDTSAAIAALFDFLADRLGGETRAQAQFILDMPAGIPWLATAEILRQIWPDHFSSIVDDLAMWKDLADNSSAVMCLDGVAFICEKPLSFHLNEDRRPHHPSEPFLTYSDGFADYAWDGVLVPKFVIEDPDSITCEVIEKTENVEVRRAMLERFGISRYISEAGVSPVHEDEYGTLYRRELAGDEALVLLKVINSTPEPDGTYKEYFLRVPPDIETAKQAVAWTFDIEPDDYRPQVQT
jgi:hypothetical protein